jgi:hypothetical protein
MAARGAMVQAWGASPCPVLANDQRYIGSFVTGGRRRRQVVGGRKHHKHIAAPFARVLAPHKRRYIGVAIAVEVSYLADLVFFSSFSSVFRAININLNSNFNRINLLFEFMIFLDL